MNIGKGYGPLPPDYKPKQTYPKPYEYKNKINWLWIIVLLALMIWWL